MAAQPADIQFRQADSERLPVTRFERPEDALEAMLQSVEGGEYHLRPALSADEKRLKENFLDLGLALRTCLDEPARRDYLIERLKPHVDVIIGSLPPGIQLHGLLPRDRAATRRLEEFSDADIRDWLISDGGLVYGELNRFELENYFDAVAPYLPPQARMIDLGSGLGKVVMTAALTLPFAHCAGVELLTYRHQMARERLAALLALGRTALAALPVPLTRDASLRLPGGMQASGAHLLDLDSRIALEEGDMFAADLSQADLVFIYSTCFAPLMQEIAAKLMRELREGALVSCTTFPMRHPGLELVAEFAAKTLAWTTVFLYRRTGALASLASPDAPYLYAPAADEWEVRARQEFLEYDARRGATP